MSDDIAYRARMERAARGYRRLVKIKLAVSVLFSLALVLVSLLVLVNAGVLWALLVFVVGGAVGRGVLGLVLVLPLGYLFCGRDAMKVGQTAETLRRGEAAA